jgi:hypothetical protein
MITNYKEILLLEADYFYAASERYAQEQQINKMFSHNGARATID